MIEEDNILTDYNPAEAMANNIMIEAITFSFFF